MKNKMSKSLNILKEGSLANYLNFFKFKKMNCSFFKSNKKAFTLAEVLITLTIIGVVSSMTIPTINRASAKRTVETRVLNFYSTFQNAIKLSIIENGPIEDWAYGDGLFTFSIGTAPYSQNKLYIEKYLAPYLKIDEITNSGYQDKALVKLRNGSSFLFNYQIGVAPNLILVSYFIDGDINNHSTRNQFVFSMSPERPFKPFDLEWDGNRAKLFTESRWGCGVGTWDGHNNPLYCTKLLELNNWRIPDDYPW